MDGRSRGDRVVTLVMSGATIKRGVNTLYFKASMAGEICKYQLVYTCAWLIYELVAFI